MINNCFRKPILSKTQMIILPNTNLIFTKIRKKTYDRQLVQFSSFKLNSPEL